MMPRPQIAFILVLTLLFGAGCHKKPAAAVSAPLQTNDTVADSAQTAAPIPVPLAQPPDAANQAAPANVRDLQKEVYKWVFQNKRRPASFEEFAASSNIQIPPPPPGKKYAFDHQLRVILVDR
jgi:hypothetical protein